jgi:hypothetical protein
MIQVCDVLVGMTAVKIVDDKWERRMIPAYRFDTVVGTITSNNGKWSCSDVILMFEHPGKADSAGLTPFLNVLSLHLTTQYISDLVTYLVIYLQSCDVTPIFALIKLQLFNLCGPLLFIPGVIMVTLFHH